jgi:hypothetical protein
VTYFSKITNTGHQWRCLVAYFSIISKFLSPISYFKAAKQIVGNKKKETPENILFRGCE